MLTLRMSPPPSQGGRSLLAVGAHPDDIEIGAGGTLLTLAESEPGLRAHYLVLTGTEDRKKEARVAADAFLPSADVTVDLRDLPEGRLPHVWREVKEVLEETARAGPFDVVVAPSADDAHQDHRTIGEILPTVFRDHLLLGYEIPKWDGDLRRPSLYVPITDEMARRKVDLLHACFPSQAGRDWWDEEVFLGLARLRGMECRQRYAEAFSCTKAVVIP